VVSCCCVQLEFLLHLLDVTGPVLDKMVRILNTMRRMIPVDKTNYMVRICAGCTLGAALPLHSQCGDGISSGVLP
jgi:hypothetical protein